MPRRDREMRQISYMDEEEPSDDEFPQHRMKNWEEKYRTSITWGVFCLALALFAGAIAYSFLCPCFNLVPKHEDSGAGSSEAQQQQIIRVYSANFLTKMLGELNGGDKKSVAHVRENLVPYLSGSSTGGLLELRHKLSKEQQTAFDNLGLDGSKLADAILALLPKEPGDSSMLHGDPKTNSITQTDELLNALFRQYPIMAFKRRKLKLFKRK